ncbi:DUF2092 domain-containing protein [Methyloglobulus sp.]|uniref:DUF2092 domain-containing protein n=1 Tax=Methyloglobulus sp. TaxID=2518622 RepID=UPI0032B86F2B
MKYRFSRNAHSALLISTLFILAEGCSTQPVATSPEPQVKPATAVESNVVEPSTIEPKAMAALQKMGGYLRSLKTFKVSFRLFKDEILLSGQKVMIDGASELTVQQPDRFHFSTKIDEAHRDQQFFYDGKTFTVYGNTNKFYASVAAPATIPELLDAASERYNITMPFADLFIWGTDKADPTAIKSAIYIGPTQINNVTCDHYAFQNEDVDWQLWIQQGDTPLPRRLVITTKEEEGQPQYISVMDWKLSPKINKQIFSFVPPKDAHKINLVANEVESDNMK